MFTGVTPLSAACKEGERETCELLLTLGADIHLEDKVGNDIHKSLLIDRVMYI